jgi:hypothetical protein
MQRTYVLLILAAGMGLMSTASAQQANADARYCDKLIGLYRTYVNNPEDPRPTFPSPQAAQENAIASCKTGNTAAGIPVLEKSLRDNKMTLPARGDS